MALRVSNSEEWFGKQWSGIVKPRVLSSEISDTVVSFDTNANYSVQGCVGCEIING